MSAEFIAKAKSAKSFEELKSLVAAEGVEVAEDELMAKWEEISAQGSAKKFKLSEEELDNVAGGCGKTYYSSVGFACTNCEYSETKLQVELDLDDTFYCPRCGTKMVVQYADEKPEKLY